MMKLQLLRKQAGKVLLLNMGSIHDPVLAGLPGGLGGRFTRNALQELGVADDAVLWWNKAFFQAGCIYGLFEGPMPEKPEENLLLVWCARAVICHSPPQWMLMSQGDMMHRGSHDLDEMLPATFVGHDRSLHAERQAMLLLVEKIVGQAANTRPFSIDAGGVMRIIALHTPCISCLSVSCQFQAVLPSVLLQIGFTDWRDTRTWAGQTLRHKL